MSSASWLEPAPAEDLKLELELLCHALDISRGSAFLFAVCEEGSLRERLVRQVRDHLQAEGSQHPVEVELSPDQPDLAGQLEQQFLYEMPSEERAAAPAAVRDRPRPPVVFIHTHGLAEPRDEAALRALRAVNFQRERLSRLGTPLVFWLSQNTLGQVVQHAADLFAARSGIFYFEAPLRGPTAPPPMQLEAVTQLLDRFHRTLLPPEELRKRAALYERRLGQQRVAETPNWPRIASLCEDLSHIYRELDDYAQASEYQDEAIAAYQRAITVQEGEDRGLEWANLQAWLGLAYYTRIHGTRAENIERAIDHYQHALEVYTRQVSPEQWAVTQGNLGLIYTDRIRGERTENLEQAITHTQAALKIFTSEDFPQDWAKAQNNLGVAYRNRIRGDHAENLELAIGQFQSTLKIYTRQDFSTAWAMAQNNLGSAYRNRIRGDRAKNIEQAISHYQRALEVYTRQAFPTNWAQTKNNLGNAYAVRIHGDPAENLEQAIGHFQHAREVRTRQDFPADWAQTQNNLGNAYRDRIHGDRAENLQRAIECYNNALSVWTAETFPRYHEIAARNLEQALSKSKPPSLRKRIQAALRRFRLRKSRP